MQKQILAIGMLALVASIGFTAISNNLVFAQGAPPTTPNNPQTNDPSGFGQGASHLGQTGQMGAHSSQQDSPRFGIGNVINPGSPNDSPLSKHPGELANTLCPPGSTDPRCPPS